LKFHKQLGTWLKKFKIKNQIEKGMRLQGLKSAKLRAKLKKIKDKWLIKGQNTQIDNQWPTWKGHWTLRLPIELDKYKTAQNWKLEST